MIQNTRIALAPYQAEYQFLTSNDAFTVFGMIHRDQIHFRFFYKKLLVGRDGIYTLFESYSENPKPFWWSPSGFLLWRKILFWIIHVRSAVFSDPSIQEIPDQLFFWFIFESCVPAWPLAFKKSSCCEKVISEIQRQVPSCQNWTGSSITMMVLRSFLTSLRLFLLSLTGCLEFLDLGFVFLGVSIIYHTKSPVYIDKVNILMMHYLYNCCIENDWRLVL